MSTPTHHSPEQDELDKILLPLHTVHCDKVSAYAPNTPKEFVHSRSCTCGVAKAHAAIRTWALKVSLECVGEDEIPDPGTTWGGRHTRNGLRAEIRTKLIEVFKQEEK